MADSNKVILVFKSENVGGGEMKLTLHIDGSNLSGNASGQFNLGTQNPSDFTAVVSGHIHSTGYGGVTKVGAVIGQAGVSTPPSDVIVLEPLTATFAVDNSFDGKGNFTIGDRTYECVVFTG